MTGSPAPTRHGKTSGHRVAAVRAEGLAAALILLQIRTTIALFPVMSLFVVGVALFDPPMAPGAQPLPPQMEMAPIPKFKPLSRPAVLLVAKALILGMAVTLAFPSMASMTVEFRGMALLVPISRVQIAFVLQLVPHLQPKATPNRRPYVVLPPTLDLAQFRAEKLGIAMGVVAARGVAALPLPTSLEKLNIQTVVVKMVIIVNTTVTNPFPPSPPRGPLSPVVRPLCSLLVDVALCRLADRTLVVPVIMDGVVPKSLSQLQMSRTCSLGQTRSFVLSVPTIHVGTPLVTIPGTTSPLPALSESVSGGPAFINVSQT